MKKINWKNVYLWVMFIFLYAPIFYLIFYAFNSGETMNKFEGFSWVHFQELFADTRLLIILLETFILAFLSALIATMIGTFGAISIYRYQKRRTRLAFLSLGFASVLLSHIAFSIPIVVLMVLPKLQEMQDSLTMAAYDLGANHWQVLTNVVLPYLTPGIIAGYFMAFTYSLDDFAVTFFVTGNGFTTLSVEIYSRARRGVSLEINALSALVFLFSLVLVIGYYFISRDNSANHRRQGKQVRKEVLH